MTKKRKVLRYISDMLKEPLHPGVFLNSVRLLLELSKRVPLETVGVFEGCKDGSVNLVIHNFEKSTRVDFDIKRDDDCDHTWIEFVLQDTQGIKKTSLFQQEDLEEIFEFLGIEDLNE